MSGFRDIVKGGWHPEKDVPLKSSFKGLLGKGQKEERTYHEATPITSLRDPASFPPPPKHLGTEASPSPPTGQPYQPPAAGASHQSYGGTHTTHNQPADGAPPSPKPYRVDTTGLSTSHLPPPPRRTGGGIASTPSPPAAQTHAKPPPPSLPPRLPPRTSTPASPAQPPPPPARSPQPEPKPQGYLNQSAINNLSSKGISVPGFGIGSPAQNSASTAPSQPAQAPSSGTTWAQKRAALQTASSLHRDPSSVSASDAASAASTLNNFHQRHGDQVGSAAGRLNASAAAAVSPAATPPHHPTPGTGAGSSVAGKKKPPPPPPPAAKKPAALAAAATHGGPGQHEDDAPPPVPLASRPRF